MKAIAAVLLILVGCSAPRLELEERWRPLVAVQETRTGIVGEGVTMTVMSTCYVPDLAAWKILHPEGAARDGLLLHEQEHARRQIQTGAWWFARYLVDADFRWAEERAGWRLELEHLHTAGVFVDVDAIADFLASDSYTIAGAPMVSRDEAKAWVLSVLAGE